MLATREGQLETARWHLDRSLAIRTEHLPDDHPDLASTYVALGDLAVREADLATALEYFDRAYAIRSERFGEDAPASRAVTERLTAIGR